MADHASVTLGTSFSSLARISGLLSELADIDAPYGTNSVPTDSPYLYAHKHGRAQSRTKNIEPDALSKMLLKCYRWVHEYGPAITSLVRELHTQLPTHGTSKTKLTIERNRILQELPQTKAVQDLLGVSVVSLKGSFFNSTTSVDTLIKMTATACFNLIAVFNGRRRDEVIDKCIGLHQAALVNVLNP